MIICIVKGTVREAQDAAYHCHGIPHQWFSTTRFGEQVLRVEDNYLELVVEWFCRTQGKAPFPPGTLLWYGVAP